MKLAENKKIQPLRRGSDFEALRENGKSRRIRSWLLLVFLKKEHQEIRLGISVSRRIGNAVVRNRFKRWIREYFRQTGDIQIEEGLDLHLVFRNMDSKFYKTLSHAEVDAALADCVRTLHDHFTKKSSSSARHV